MARLFLDDERFPVGDGWVIVRSCEAAIAWVLANGCPAYVSFDNDLGAGRREGWEFAQWLIERDLDVGDLPAGFSFYVHSQNPVRRDDIAARLHGYLGHRARHARSP